MAEMKAVQIFAVGTWNQMKFVQEDLAQIVENTNSLMKQGKHRPPIKLGHSTNQILGGQEDGDPSLGGAINFAASGDKVIADFENLPDIIYEAIQKSRFTSVSVEMDHIKHFGWFITAVSLLGADLPAVKTLDDLQAFLIDATKDSSKVNTASLQFSEPFLLKTSHDIGENKMGDEPKTDLAAEALVKKNAELEAELAEFKAKDVKTASKFTDTEKELNQYKAKETERSFADKKESILKEYTEDAKAKKLAPAIVEKISVFLDSQKATFKEGDELSISPELAREVGKAYADGLPDGESAKDDGDEDNTDTPDMILDQEIAKVRASNSDLSWEDADELVMQSQPKMYAEYQTWANNIAQGRT